MQMGEFNMILVRRIGDKNRLSIPQDVMEQMNLKVGDAINIDVQHIDGIPTIQIRKGVIYAKFKD